MVRNHKIATKTRQSRAIRSLCKKVDSLPKTLRDVPSKQVRNTVKRVNGLGLINLGVFCCAIDVAGLKYQRIVVHALGASSIENKVDNVVRIRQKRKGRSQIRKRRLGAKPRLRQVRRLDALAVCPHIVAVFGARGRAHHRSYGCCPRFGNIGGVGTGNALVRIAIVHLHVKACAIEVAALTISELGNLAVLPAVSRTPGRAVRAGRGHPDRVNPRLLRTSPPSAIFLGSPIDGKLDFDVHGTEAFQRRIVGAP